MAIQQATAWINGQGYPLAYDAQTGLYKLTATAPAGSSFPLAGGYYPVKLSARTDFGERAEADDRTPGLGESLRLVVKESDRPTVEIVSPAYREVVQTSRPAIVIKLRDWNSGIDLSSFSLQFNAQEYSLEELNITASQVAGGYDLVYLPRLEPSLKLYTVMASCCDNDGNFEHSDFILFSVNFSGLPVHTDALCARPLPGWRAQPIQAYQPTLLGPVYRAAMIRRCHCV